MTRPRGRPGPPSAGAPGRTRTQRTKTLLAVVIPVALAAGLIVALAPDSDDDAAPVVSSTTTTTLRGPTPEGEAWQTRIDDAFDPLADRLPEFVEGSVKWVAGEKPTDAFSADLQRILPELVRARDAVAAVPALEEAPTARDLYRDAAALYVEVARIYLVAVEPDADPLKAQLDLAARRLRTLADRVYDRARALIDPSSQQDLDSEDVEIRRPPEVPDWVAEGLAAGSPLTGAPPPAAETPPQREDVRPEEPVKKWLDRVRDEDIATPRELARRIDGGDEGELASVASDYYSAAMRLRDAPDPAGGRERGALLGLSLLVHSEAARLGQAAATLPDGAPRARLQSVARRVTLVAEDTLEPDVRGQASGLDPGLLTEPGP